MLRTLYDKSGRVLEVSDFLLAGEKHALVYEVLQAKPSGMEALRRRVRP
jgi:hypothetical protein